MHGDIPKGKLLVISDTALYKEGNTILGFEPVVRELEALQSSFSEIIWLGSRTYNKSSMLRAPEAANIRMVVMPSTSHTRLNAVKVFLSYPVFLYYILRYLPGCRYVHTRGPSHPAILAILLSFIDRGRIYWHKYAGDWSSQSAPGTYRLQRNWLRKLAYPNIKVTINGKWDNEPGHIYPFENPCLYESELIKAAEAAKAKDFSGNLSLLFVGNLNNNKGIANLIDALRQYEVPAKITDLYVIGSGPLLDAIREKAAANSRGRINIHILGPLKREAINRYYASCHFLVLPSRSEGFPKVIAEAAAYGCIPVTTDISSLSQYILRQENGYLMPDNNAKIISETLHTAVHHGNYELLSAGARSIVNLFTYEHFVQRIRSEIFEL